MSSIKPTHPREDSGSAPAGPTRTQAARPTQSARPTRACQTALTLSLLLGTLAAASTLGACTPAGPTWEPPADQDLTLGQEIYGVLCDRVASADMPADVTARRSRKVCHEFAEPAPDVAPRLLAMHQNRERLVSALDVALSASGLDSELDTFLFELLPLYDPPAERLPDLTRALGALLDAVRDDPAALASMQRMAARRGYRPGSLALGAAQATFQYPGLHGFLSTFLQATAPGGSAAPAFDGLLTALALELADYQPADPADGESTLAAASQLLFARVDDGSAAATPRLLARRDARGLAIPNALCSSGGCDFPDLDGDGNADIDAATGAHIKAGLPSPFAVSVPDSAVRDAEGRALTAAGGAPLYEYVDASKTFMGALSGELVTMLQADDEGRNDVLDLLHGLSVVLGPQVDAEVSFGQTAHSYPASDTRASTLIDLVQFFSVVARSPDFPEVLQVFSTLLREREEVVAAAAKSMLDARELFVNSDAAMAGPNNFWDEFLYWLELMARTSRVPDETMLEAVMRAMTDPQAYHYGDILAQMLRYKDSLLLDKDDINNLPQGQLLTPVDRSAPNTPDNRSIMQKSLHLVGDINAQTGLCNRAVLGIVAECSVMDYHDLGRIFGAAMSEEWNLELGDVQPLVDLLGGGGLVEGFMGIEGLDDYPSPNALIRMWFGDNALVDLIMDPLTVRNAPDATEQYWLKRIYEGSIEAWEVPFRFDDGSEVAFWDAFRPLAVAFNRHDYDPDDPEHVDDEHLWYDYMEIASAIGRYYGAPDGGFATDWSEPGFNHAMNLVSYEGPLADMLSAPGMLPTECTPEAEAENRCWVTEETLAQHPINLGVAQRLFDFLTAVGEIPLEGGGDGLDAMSGIAEFALNPHKACNPWTQGKVRPDGTGPCDADDAPFPSLGYRRYPGDSLVTFSTGERLDGTAQLQLAANIPLVQDTDGRPVVPWHRDAVGVDDDGNGGTPYMPVQHAAPLQLLLRTLNDIDASFEDEAWSTEPERLSHWRSARGHLVDQFMATDGTRFENRAAFELLVAIVDFMRDRIVSHTEGVCADSADSANGETPPAACGQACSADADCGGALHCDPGGVCQGGDLHEWLESLTPRAEVFMQSPVVAGALQLVEVTQTDAALRGELMGFLSYLFDEGQTTRSFDATLLALLDTVQVMQDDTNMVPLMRSLSNGMSLDARRYVRGEADTLDLEGGPAKRVLNGVRDILARDSQQAMALFLRNLVVTDPAHLGRREAPLDTLVDVVAEVNRAAPASDFGNQMRSEDFDATLSQVSAFMLDERRGLERIYDVVQNRAGPVGPAGSTGATEQAPPAPSTSDDEPAMGTANTP